MRWRGAAAHALCALAVVGAVAYLYGDLLDHHAFLSHEQFFTYARAHEVAEELRSGHVPQVFGDAIWGAGYAFPRFYPPFSLWLSAALAMAVGDTCLGVNLTFFLSALASGLAMYWAGNALTADRRLALAAAFVYVSVPYRFVDVFARGALAESWTFVWYPLIVVGMWRTVSRRQMVWYLPVAVAGLVLSHNITALYFTGFCAALVAAAWWWHGRRSAGLAALGIGLGFGLALWFLIPQQYYMSGVWVSDREFMWTDIAHVYDHRVMPLQFFYSFPRRWFGESHSPQWPDGMSFELGAAELLLIPVGLAFVRARRNGTARRRGRLIALAWLALVAWCACIAFMIWPGAFLTVLPRQFTYIQFPWRLLSPAAFFATLGICLFGRAARLSTAARYALVVAGIVFVAVVPTFERTRWSEPDWTDAKLMAPERLRDDGGLGYTVLGEYLPRDFDVEAYRDGQIDGAIFDAPRVVAGSTSIAAWSRSGLDVNATLGPGSGDVVFPLVYYDFYRATSDDGRPLETFSKDGLLGVQVPRGVASVAITRGLTWVSLAGLAASAAAALATAGCAIAFRRRRTSRARAAGPHALDLEPEGEPESALSGRR